MKRQIDIVNIFRRLEYVPPIVDQAIELRKTYRRPSVIGMLLGIVNGAAVAEAKGKAIDVVMDRCLMAEHTRRSSPT